MKIEVEKILEIKDIGNGRSKGKAN